MKNRSHWKISQSSLFSVLWVHIIFRFHEEILTVPHKHMIVLLGESIEIKV